jgi:hypothetical protein
MDLCEQIFGLGVGYSGGLLCKNIWSLDRVQWWTPVNKYLVSG